MGNQFDEETLLAGTMLIDRMTDERKMKWDEGITSTNMMHNSRLTWKMSTNLSSEPSTITIHPYRVNANQTAHPLLINAQYTNE